MDVTKLQFFDKDGYNLNFERNSRFGYWEGSIYLPKVSVGLYANTSIYVLEYNGDQSESENNADYIFPIASSSGDKITFTWDARNKFVDEFFMFNFDETYTSSDTSSLKYTPNDGPECNILIVNRFDEYEIPLSTEISSKALPIHIAFMANEKYDATTYNRTLIMSYNDTVIAKIKFFAETVEEDERLKIWNANLGYKLTPEDELIFYKSDINEHKPDYQLLNEKRKELMMEGSNIYPYIGSYKAIINAIKFFGYDNLGIIEFWKNVNVDDENFGKIYHSSRYSLTKKETLTVGARNIKLPNKDYKKINKIALVYSINTPTGDVDEWELPLMKEEFTYTIEEAVIKLFALRKKLNNEFMPGSSRICDIIGEANYFGLQGLTKIGCSIESHTVSDEYTDPLEFSLFPDNYVYLTDDRYFNNYMKEVGYDCTATTADTSYKNYISNFYTVSSISDITLSDISSSLSTYTQASVQIPNTEGIVDYYKTYYNAAFVDHTRYDEDIYDDLDDVYAPLSAKIILSNDSMKDLLFEDCDAGFGNTSISSDTITSTWTISRSCDQYDDDLKAVGIEKNYYINEYPNSNKSVKPGKNELTGNDLYSKTVTGSTVLVTLPYVGYYDLTLTSGTQTRTKKKCIKVEPYELELRGFYFDARELPSKINYDITEDEDMYDFVLDKLQRLLGWATSEKTSTDWNPETPGIKLDQSMPIYSGIDNSIINTGPYREDNMGASWCILDHITYELTTLDPYVKYARYIRNGVDIKPYTWFMLTYNYGKLSGIINDENYPEWTITNTTTGETQTYIGRYLTCLLKTEGNYNISLSVMDTNENKYEVSRNIIVVSNTANYNIYQTFKTEYDYIVEQDELAEARDLQEYNLS